VYSAPVGEEAVRVFMQHRYRDCTRRQRHGRILSRPGQANVDSSMSKTAGLALPRQGSALSFRAEFFQCAEPFAVRESRYGIRFPNVRRYQTHGNQGADRPTGHRDQLLRVVDSSWCTSSGVCSFSQDGAGAARNPEEHAQAALAVALWCAFLTLGRRE
jgi:hypothetical protein